MGHWWDGPGGKLMTTWNIHLYPTVIELDGKGVVRHKGLRGEKLEAAVKALLAEGGE